jgi:hypothetical protein
VLEARVVDLGVQRVRPVGSSRNRCAHWSEPVDNGLREGVASSVRLRSLPRSTPTEHQSIYCPVTVPIDCPVTVPIEC